VSSFAYCLVICNFILRLLFTNLCFVTFKKGDYGYRVALGKNKKQPASILVLTKGQTQPTIDGITFKAVDNDQSLKQHAAEFDMAQIHELVKHDDITSRFSGVLYGAAKLTDSEAVRQHAAKLRELKNQFYAKYIKTAIEAKKAASAAKEAAKKPAGKK